VAGFPGTGESEQGVFQLNAANMNLMNDAAGRQFRFIQKITADSNLADPGAKFNPPNKNGMSPTLPYIDPPAGGYASQAEKSANNPSGMTTPGPGGGYGADNSPFYENDDDAKYAFPSYAATHNQAKGWSSTFDSPGAEINLSFETFIVYVDPGLLGNKQFDVLAGYSWTATAGTAAFGMNLPINAAELADINKALKSDGFGSWTAITGYDIRIPEPGSVLLLAVGLGGLLLGKARKRLWLWVGTYRRGG